MSIRMLVLSLLLTTAVGCGAKQGETAKAPALPKPPKAWTDMTHDEKFDYMSEEVVSRMEDAFVGHDAKRFADFSCGTCHGAGADDGTYKMPNAAIMAIPRSGTPEQKELVKNHRPMLQFMFNQVYKPMREMLDLPEYDPKTNQGFGCFSCHPVLESAK